ncbi:MAG: Na+/H+ antiporter NhaA [Bacteroidota bacterium]
MTMASLPKPIEALQKVSNTFTTFFESSISGGVILLLCTACAMVWANSPYAQSYGELWEYRVSIGIGQFGLSKTLHHWINDGLMAVFFFMVGLEIKRELLVGELSSLKKAMLPIVAAIGGMIGPALIYTAFNAGTPAVSGWGIPMATDIAFALGVLALLGDRIPVILKVFLAALAIVDDMGAVLVIAIFYTSELALPALLLGGAIFILLLLANKMNLRSPIVYFVLGVGLWFCFLKSGVHATVAGVLLATTIPVTTKINKRKFLAEAKSAINELEDDQSTKSENELIHTVAALSEDAQSPLHRFEHALQPYVAFFIMPVFAVANAGVALQSGIISSMFSPVSLGIIAGLIIGKQTGIVLFTWLAVQAGIAALPDMMSWKMIYGVSWLCAIGFTMALFIAGLAFDDEAALNTAKIAILIASSIAGIVGLVLLRRSSKKRLE